eukprot:6350-Heterococcus_DN1.PRE.2
MGADVSAVDCEGNTALRLCMQGDAKAMVCYTVLVKAGSDVFNVAPESRPSSMLTASNCAATAYDCEWYA